MILLKCECCGFEQEFEDTEAAFRAGWDEGQRLSGWPICCNLCPGVAALGLVDHSVAHNRWKAQGHRDEDFRVEDLPKTGKTLAGYQREVMAKRRPNVDQLSDAEEIATLDGLTSGRYVITTEHGTRHSIDLDRRTVIRLGAPGREWDGRVFVPVTRAALAGTQPKFAAREEHITADGEPLSYTVLIDPTVGKCMQFENNREWRSTSRVVFIEKIDAH